MSVPWLARLQADRRIISAASALRQGRAAALSAAAPRIADSRYGHEIDALLATIARGRIESDAGLALAAGRRALLRDAVAEGLGWLVRAQSAVGPGARVLAARIAFYLGGSYVTRAELAPADAVLAWAEGLLGRAAAGSADLLHLRALLAEARGERDKSLALYRRTIVRSPNALTPLTRVLALRNLGEALSHSEPHESVALYGLALAIVEADQLDDNVRSTVDNTMGYALICIGDLQGGRLKLEQALREANAHARKRTELYAAFNLAIAAELEGSADAARLSLEGVRDDAIAVSMRELALWAEIRLAWLDVKAGRTAEARTRLRSVFPAAIPLAYREATGVLHALLGLRASPAAARGELTGLARTHAARGDDLGAFAITLWGARADAAAGRIASARRGAAAACALGSQRGFRLASNWWSAELVATAREHAPPEFADYAESLVAPPSTDVAEPPPAVTLMRDGTIVVGGARLGTEVWRGGRTGRRVLERFFVALVAAYPAAIARDALADLLWPESEGDKAIRNLYGATNDLRRILASVPGVSLAVVDQRYALRLEEQVRLS
ncbi:MAG: hypothetical protein ABR525_10030 [Candidatus Limnocylindria bacterium]